MTAGIISVGDEILSGQVEDSNFPFLARRLGEMGIAVEAHLAVGDSREDLRQAIERLCRSCQVVLITGGLGPTADDITRYALAEALGSELELDRQALEQVKECFARHGRKMMTKVNRIQAMIPAGGRAIENKWGTAPGIAGKIGQAEVFALPGVPHEMRGMFVRSVVPELRRSGLAGKIIICRRLHCCGSGESNIFSRIKEFMVRPANPQIGITAADGIISVSITARADSTQAAEAMLDEKAGEIAERLGDDLFGRDEQTLGQVAGRLLVGRNQKLAVAESCTGGLVGKLLTDMPGASDFLVADVVSYANQAKVRLLGVAKQVIEQYGAVSEQCAGAMASGAVERLGVDWGLSVTGVAGPGGGTEEKPVGLVYIGLARRGAGDKGQVVGLRECRFRGERGHIRARASVAALDYLRRALLKEVAG